MKIIASKFFHLMLAFVLFPAFLVAQEEQPVEEAPVKLRSDTEIIAGLEVYVANMDEAYVELREERDALRERVEELETEIESLKNL